MTKSKSLTIALITVTVLLIASLVATITLAAFHTNRSATTTIYFSQGVKIEVTGITEDAQNTGIYAWNGTQNNQTTLNTTGEFEDVTNFTLEKINIKNISSLGIYLIAKVNIDNITTTDKNADANITIPTTLYATGWTAYTGHAGWYVYGAYNDDTLSLTTLTANADVDFTKADFSFGGASVSNDFAGQVFEATFQVIALDATSGTATELEELITLYS